MKTYQQIYPGVALTFGTMLVMTLGCRTFDYTGEEMEREQRRLDMGPSERASSVRWTPGSSVDSDKLLRRAIGGQPRTFSHSR